MSDVKLSHLASGTDLNGAVQTTETRLADLLDSTLWNRKPAPPSERIVYALVQQIFHGISEYFLASAELKFNCFLLMPVVDKLPALLGEDLTLHSMTWTTFSTSLIYDFHLGIRSVKQK